MATVSIAQSRPIPLQLRSRAALIVRLYGFNRSIAPNPSTTPTPLPIATPVMGFVSIAQSRPIPLQPGLPVC